MRREAHHVGAIVSHVMGLLLLLSLPGGGWCLNFFSIGDWGSGKPNQTAVAGTMATWADRLSPSFILALGDNFYEAGVQNVTDPLWQSRFETVYTAPSLQVPWVALLGNHDYYGGHPQAQVDYYHKQSPLGGRWYMPARYYKRQWDIGGEQGATLEVVVIDTVPLAAETHVEGMTMMMMMMQGGEVEADGAVTTIHHQRSLLAQEGRKQLAWIERTLAASTADYLVVAGHFPVYSAGHHGDTEELVRDLKPMLEAHHVTAYLCGHDHTLQYLEDEEEGEGVGYFVSGSGGADVYTLHPTPQARYAASESGFTAHEVTAESMKVTIVGRDGEELFIKAFPPRRRHLRGP